MISHIYENAGEFDKREAAAITENRIPAESYMPNLYASVLDKLSIRPFFSFLNNFDLLPLAAQNGLNSALSRILRKRVAFCCVSTIHIPRNSEDGESASFMQRFIWRGELNNRALLERLIRDRYSLLVALFGDVDDFLNFE